MLSERGERLSVSAGGRMVTSSLLVGDLILTELDSDHSLTHKVPIKKEKEDDERPVFRRLLRQYESDEEGEILNTKPQRQYEDGKPLFSRPLLKYPCADTDCFL